MAFPEENKQNIEFYEQEWTELRPDLKDELEELRRASRTLTDALEGRRTLDFNFRFVSDEEIESREKLEYRTWIKFGEAQLALAKKLSRLRYERSGT